MAMQLQPTYTPLNPGKGWRDSVNWPDTPADTAAARDRFQSPHDQTIDYLNDFLNYCTDTGTANTLIINPVPAFNSYRDNMTLLVKVANANTGAVTINVNNLGAKSIKKWDGSDLLSGEISAGQILLLKWDGTNFQLLSYSQKPLPVCKAYNSNNVSLSSGVWTTISFNQDTLNVDSMHDTVTNNERITINTPGIYNIGAIVSFNTSVTAKNALKIMLNSTTQLAITDAYTSSGYSQNINVSTIAQLSAGDYITLQAYCSSATTVVGGATAPTHLFATLHR